MNCDKAKVLLVVLAVIGAPTTGYGLYLKYIKIGTEIALSGADSIALYKQCINLRANTFTRRPEEVKAFLAEMEKKLPGAVDGGSKLVVVNAVIDGKVSSPNIAAELPKCVSALRKETAQSGG